MPNTHLSLVNKQLNCEAIAALLIHTNFHFQTVGQSFEFFFRRKDEVSRVKLRPHKELRSLELDLSPDCLLHVFGVNFVPSVFSVRDSGRERSLALDLSVFFNADCPLSPNMHQNPICLPAQPSP